MPTIKKSFPDGNWVKSVNRHVTLLFLGDLEKSEMESLCSFTQDLLPHYKPLQIDFTHLDAFPHRFKVNTLYYAVKPQPVLEKLGQELRNLSLKYGVQDQQRFTPHITLARFRPAIILPKQHSWASFSMNESQLFDRFELALSILKPTGPIYQSVATFTFPKEEQHG